MTFTGNDSCQGFQQTPFPVGPYVTAAGTLPHVQGPDGSMATDTTYLETHLSTVHGQIKAVLDQLDRDVNELKTTVGGQNSKLDTVTSKCKRMKATISKAAQNLTTYVNDSVDVLYAHQQHQQGNQQQQQYPQRQHRRGHATSANRPRPVRVAASGLVNSSSDEDF